MNNYIKSTRHFCPTQIAVVAVIDIFMVTKLKVVAYNYNATDNATTLFFMYCMEAVWSK